MQLLLRRRKYPPPLLVHQPEPSHDRMDPCMYVVYDKYRPSHPDVAAEIETQQCFSIQLFYCLILVSMWEL